MILLPTIMFSDLWDGCLDSPHRASQFACKHQDRQPFPGGFLVTFEHSPKSCEQKPCCNNPSQCKTEEKKQKVTDKATKNFEVSLDVQEFRPEDLSVKATKQFLIVEGKHEEKDGANGYVLNQFVRRYQLPAGYDSERIESTLSSDGVLTISAPALALPAPSKEQLVTIPVENDREQLVIANREKITTPDEKRDTKENKEYTLEDLDE